MSLLSSPTRMRLKTFATLSPVPGFRPWLLKSLEEHKDNGGNNVNAMTKVNIMPTRAEAEHIRKAWPSFPSASCTVSDVLHEMEATLSSSRPRSDNDVLAQNAVRPFLSRLCLEHIVRERACQVARFHLRNGAQLEHMNWCADSSELRTSQSYGMMVSYVYSEKESVLESRQKAFLQDGIYSVSEEVLELLGHLARL
eukprot:TRINITY_DN11006_c0_g1_i2.p1 TRINITY_DN11006_c0_g1~~TRINITY_DN11006_c0_g1_i2.p1  ORF type:complete len:197 (+),score=27.49 TRINITY_DN11006_c0_g1_i2:81-671(+)